MKRKLLEMLVCPELKSPLTLLDAKIGENDEIESGYLLSATGRRYPIIDRIPRFVDTEFYTNTFSVQRNYMKSRFEEWIAEEGRHRKFCQAIGIDLSKVSGKLILDAGVGYGRYAQPVAQAGGELVGVDLSKDSIELANRYIGSLPNVHLVQCDLTALPFRRDVFDVLFSIGVLHHTPSTRASFEQLVPYVKPGGEVTIWVYPPEMKVREDRLRKVTTRLPHHVLYVLCILRATKEKAKDVLRSWLGWQEEPRIPRFWPYVMGHFDSLSPKYAYSHTPEEVISWFKDCNLENIRTHSWRTAVSGIRATKDKE